MELGILPSHGNRFELTVPTTTTDFDSHAEEAVDALRFDRVSFTNATWQDVVDFFKDEYAHGNMTFRPVYLEIAAPTSKKLSLQISNVSGRALLELACQQTGASYAVDGERVIILPDIASKKHYKAEAIFRYRLSTIIIDKFNFERPWEDNIGLFAKFLTDESKRRDPTHRGISVLVGLPPKPHSLESAPVNREAFSLTDVPLSEVLGYVAQQSGLTYRLDPEKNTVILTAPSPNK